MPVLRFYLVMKKQLDNYWNGNLNNEEKKNLFDELMSNDHHLKQSLKSDFFKNLQNNENQDAELEQKLEPVLQSILLQIEKKQNKKQLSPFKNRKIFYYAASVLLPLFLVFLMLKPYSSTNTLTQNFQLIENTQTNTNIAFRLMDGTTVKVFPGGILKIYHDYNVQSREIELLQGRALFKVAKDAKKKFIVHAQDYQTIALGTEFEVHRQNNSIKIDLKEGKVVVNSNHSAKFKIASHFLNPGESLMIIPNNRQVHKELKSITIQPYKKEEIILKKENTIYTPKPIETKNILVWGKNYSQIALSRVFTELNELNQVEISYDTKEVEDMLFTGKIKSSDSLSVLLDIICQSNDLLLSKEGQKYKISKIIYPQDTTINPSK